MAKKFFSTIWRILAAGSLTVGLAVLSIKIPKSDAFYIIAAAAFALLLGLIIWNNIAAVRLVKSYRGNIAEKQKELLARRDLIQENYLSALQKLCRLRAKTIAYTVLVFVLAVIFNLALGNANVVYLALIVFWIYYDILTRLRFPKRYDFSDYTKPEDYPLLHATAHRAAKELGIDGEIRICILPDCNAGIAKLGRIYSLQFGSVLLQVLTQEELYQVLLHEFAHIKNADPRTYKVDKMVDFFSNEFAIAPFTNLLFRYAEAKYGIEYTIYKFSSSIVIEQLADDAIRQKGDPSVAAGALAKVHLYDFFYDNIGTYMEELFYEPEEPTGKLTRRLASAYQKTLREKEAFWRGLIENEIQPRNATHPILRERLHALGADHFELFAEEPNEAYRAECDHATQTIDNEMLENLKQNYAERRQENYLKPLETVTAWEARGKTYTLEGLREIADALMALCRFDELLELCDTVLSQEQGGAMAYAKFLKGNILLDRYDPAGIEILYEAAEGNSNYAEEAVERIGRFCCIMGLEEELEIYRTRAVAFAQKEQDEISHRGSLTAKDNLVLESELPAEIKERIISFAVEAWKGSLVKMYLVRKVISPTYFCSSFVFEYEKDTPPQLIDEAMNQMFEHLDNSPEDWDYAIFLYNNITAAALKKVPGCCVYEKEK